MTDTNVGLGVPKVEKEHTPEELAVIRAAMMDDLGIGRKGTLHLENIKGVSGPVDHYALDQQKRAKDPSSDEFRITKENASAIAAWNNATFDDVDPADLELDDLDRGQSHRRRMVAGLEASMSSRESHALHGDRRARGPRAGHAVRGGHTSRSRNLSRGGYTPHRGSSPTDGQGHGNSRFERLSGGDRMGRVKPQDTPSRLKEQFAPKGGHDAGHMADKSMKAAKMTLKSIPKMSKPVLETPASAHEASTPSKLSRTIPTGMLADPDVFFAVAGRKTINSMVKESTPSLPTSLLTPGELSLAETLYSAEIVAESQVGMTITRIGLGTVKVVSDVNIGQVSMTVEVIVGEKVVVKEPLVKGFEFKLESSSISFKSNFGGKSRVWTLKAKTPSIATSLGDALTRFETYAVSTVVAMSPEQRAPNDGLKPKIMEELISFSEDLPVVDISSMFAPNLLAVMENSIMAPALPATTGGQEHPKNQGTKPKAIEERVEDKISLSIKKFDVKEPQKSHIRGLATSKFAYTEVVKSPIRPSIPIYESLRTRPLGSVPSISNKDFDKDTRESIQEMTGDRGTASGAQITEMPSQNLKGASLQGFNGNSSGQKSIVLGGLATSKWASPLTPNIGTRSPVPFQISDIETRTGSSKVKSSLRPDAEGFSQKTGPGLPTAIFTSRHGTPSFLQANHELQAEKWPRGQEKPSSEKNSDVAKTSVAGISKPDAVPNPALTLFEASKAQTTMSIKPKRGLASSKFANKNNEVSSASDGVSLQSDGRPRRYSRAEMLALNQIGENSRSDFNVSTRGNTIIDPITVPSVSIIPGVSPTPIPSGLTSFMSVPTPQMMPLMATVIVPDQSMPGGFREISGVLKNSGISVSAWMAPEFSSFKTRVDENIAPVDVSSGQASPTRIPLKKFPVHH